jgi:hypothetical protein
MEQCVLMVSTALRAFAWMDFKVHPSVCIYSANSLINISNTEKVFSAIYNKTLEFIIFSAIVIKYKLLNWSCSLKDCLVIKNNIIITGNPI